MAAIARLCFRRRLLAAAAMGVMLVLAVPVLSLRLGSTLPRVPDVAAVTPVAARAEVIPVIPCTSPEDRATADVITALRGAAIPAAEHGATLLVYVGGVTATLADFASFAGAKLVRFLVTIVVLSFHLLVMAFRSLLIPATVAFGVLTAFFQWGWGLLIPAGLSR